MGLPRKLKDFNLFNDGAAYIGLVPELTLPKLSRKMEEYRAGGMSGPVMVDMGNEALTLEWTAGGLIVEALTQYAAKSHNAVQLRFAGAFQNDDTGEVSAMEVVVRGRHKEIDMGSAKVGDDNGLRKRFPLLDAIITKIAKILPTTDKGKDKQNSPSRDFAGYGADHGQDRVGLQHTKAPPIHPASAAAKRFAQLGAGIAIGAATMPAMAFNVHPPLAPRAAGSGTVIQGDTNQITITTAPGMDEQAIARSVANALEQRDRKKAARLRSSLHDYD